MPDLATTADNLEQPLPQAPAAPAAKPRICPNCSEPFVRPVNGPGGHKRYCSAECRNAWGNREKAEGAVSATLLKIWAANRNNDVGNLAFARLREIGDLLNENDAAEGRHRLKANGPLDAYVREVVEERYLDRKRR